MLASSQRARINETLKNINFGDIAKKVVSSQMMKYRDRAINDELKSKKFFSFLVDFRNGILGDGELIGGKKDPFHRYRQPPMEQSKGAPTVEQTKQALGPTNVQMLYDAEKEAIDKYAKQFVRNVEQYLRALQNQNQASRNENNNQNPNTFQQLIAARYGLSQLLGSRGQDNREMEMYGREMNDREMAR